ncbi:MAG: hypothetical protein KBS66_04675, partial [Eubacterium sp.]|nr:hypothetical protein [Candidatus Colimonas fimequi]
MKKRFISLLTSAVVAASMMFAGTVATFADVEAPAVEETTPVVQEVTDEEQAEAEAVVEDEAAEAPAANEALEGDTELQPMDNSVDGAEAVTISGSTKIGEYEGDAVYYATVPAGTTSVQFTDFEADDIFTISRYDMMADETVMAENTCPVYSSFKASRDVIDEFLDDGILEDDSNDYNNTYGFLVYTENDEYYYFFINVGTGNDGEGDDPVPEPLPQLSTIYGSGKLISETYSYYDFNAGTLDNYPVYQLNVPACADEVTLNVDKDCLFYNYDGAGEYLAGAVDDPTKGTKSVTVKVDANNDGKGDYIQVQNPYIVQGTAWRDGKLRYAVKLNPVSATANVGKMIKSDEEYPYSDFMAGTTNMYKVMDLVVPKGTDEVTLNLSEECLVYNYDGAGEYLAGAVDDPTKGAKSVTVKVDANNDGKGDYIQIQNPYVVEGYNWLNGEMLFAIKMSYQPEYASATLSTAAYTYDGNAKSPAVTVKNDEGTTLVKGTDYTVAYKNNKTVG